MTGTRRCKDGSVKINIPLNPYTKKTSARILRRKSKNGGYVSFIAPSKQYKKYETDCGVFLRPLNIVDPVNVEAHYYMQTRRRVDLTNLNQALHDILVKGGVIEDDNSTIIVGTDGSRVHYDKENPRTEVVITKAEKTFLTELPPKKAKSAKKGKKRA